LSRRVFGLCDPCDGVGTFDQPSRPGAVGLESRGAHGEGSAAGAFRVLKLLGLSVDREESVERTLRNHRDGSAEDPGGNLYGMDFLVEVGYPLGGPG